MEFETAVELQRKNIKTDCPHTKIEKEYFKGSHTGDYVCTQCGKNFSLTEYIKLK